MGTLLLAPVFSNLFRILSYVFLQVIPTRIAVPALPFLYIAYLVSLILNPSAKPEAVHDPDSKKPAPAPSPTPKDPSGLTAVLLSLKTRRRLPNITNVVINTALLLASLDLALNPLVYREEDVIFTRLGAVYPDAAKITVRYPGQEGPSHDIQVLYREASSSATWKNGPFLTLSEEHDWVNTTKLSGLWPSTDYEYTFSTADGIFLPYPHTPIRFQTFPDPRLGVGSRFKFIVSSCVTPNFPYKGPHHRKTIEGFDMLVNSFAAPPQPEAILTPSEEAAPANATSENNESTPVDVNATTPATEVAPSGLARLLPKFMLFLGDFIYADVPIYFGNNEDAYINLYRRNYASPSFRRLYEHLPMLHVYDDHEIINNWGGEGRDSEPYPDASKAFQLYNGLANYDSPTEGEHYFNFTYGDVAFFVMDTRRYRSDIDAVLPSERTMLGERQLEAFNFWLGKVNETASFKFIISSVPFTSLWGHDAQRDSWAGYEAEKARILDALYTVPNVFILSGDRHEFAAIEFSGPTNGSHPVVELSTSPLNMFYIPLVRTLSMESQEVVKRTKTEVVLTDEGPELKEVEESIPKERVLKYIPTGNVKWSSIEVDSTNRSRPILHLETWIDGKVAYELETVGAPVKGRSSSALILSGVPTTIKKLLEKMGLQSKQWF